MSIGPSYTLKSLVKKIVGNEGEKASVSSCLSVTFLRESVSVTPGLLLCRGLWAPLDVAPLEAAVDADRQVVRDASGEFNDLLNTDISKSRGDDISWEAKESLGDLTGTRVLIVKRGDESKGFTPKVGLEMGRTLGEDRTLTLTQGIDNESRPVLLNKPRLELTTAGEVQELGRSGMRVRRVHSTRCQLTDVHSHPIGEERGEVGDVGQGKVSTGADRGTNSSIEIEQPISVILEDIETGHLGGGQLQIGHELCSLGGIRDLSGSVESGASGLRIAARSKTRKWLPNRWMVSWSRRATSYSSEPKKQLGASAIESVTSNLAISNELDS